MGKGRREGEKEGGGEMEWLKLMATKTGFRLLLRVINMLHHVTTSRTKGGNLAYTYYGTEVQLQPMPKAVYYE